MDPSTVIDECYGRYRELEADNALYRDKISRICVQVRRAIKTDDENERKELLHKILFENEVWNTAYNSSNDPNSAG